MKKITFELPIFNALNEGPLRLGQHIVSVEMELEEGEHVFTSAPIEIGTYFHYSVFAQLRIPYSYDSEMHYITIAGPEDTSDKQITIHSNLNQYPGITDIRQLNHNATNINSHNLWTDAINTTPVIKETIQSTIRLTIDALVKSLLECGLDGVIQTGTAPIVTPHNFKKYQDMFAPEKTTIDQPSLSDIQEIQQIVFSTYYGTITWNYGYSFANIIGSTNDPKPAGYNSWIQLWADKCNGGNYTTHCSSYNHSNGKTPFNCNTSGFVGGHVIPGTVASKVAKGGTAYIFPICSRHNANDNIYMSMIYNPLGVVLHNYNQ